jgi:flagellar biosynthesis chaperone FliJ
MKKRYPLEPLVTLRREKVDRRARELGETERQAAREKEALAGVKARRVEAQERAKGESAAERARLEQGLERAHDLTRGELYRVSERLRLETLAAAERTAAKKTEAAARAVDGARTALGAARADERALEREKDRFRRGVERAALSAEEEAAADFHTVLSRKRKG